jgi:glutamate dehydrogenase
VSDLPDDPLLGPELLRYFPAALREQHEPLIEAHRLRREITTLQVVNSLVNRCGPTFVHNVAGRTGAPAAAIARAFTVVRNAWKLRALWGDIEGLDTALKAEAQTRMLVASQRFLVRAVQWTLRRLPQPPPPWALGHGGAPALPPRGAPPAPPAEVRRP